MLKFTAKQLKNQPFTALIRKFLSDSGGANKKAGGFGDAGTQRLKRRDSIKAVFVETDFARCAPGARRKAKRCFENQRHHEMARSRYDKAFIL